MLLQQYSDVMLLQQYSDVMLLQQYSDVIYCIVCLNQTTEVKKLPIAPVTQFYNSHSAMSQTVSHSRGSFSSTDHSIWQS